MVSLQYLMSKTWLWVTRFFCSPGIRFLQTGVLLSGSLRVDNSALNGEAEECKKEAADGSTAFPEDITGDTFVDEHSLFRGAVVFDGEGVLDVRKVGLKDNDGENGRGNAGG